MLNIKQDKSPYYSSRGSWKITGVVIHTTVGNYEGTLNWFRNNDRKVSAHYVVREDGAEITQMVDESKAAHHAGLVSNPSTPVYRGSNPNFYTVGVENADGGRPHEHIRDGQYRALAELVRDICRRNNIPIDREHICGHKEIYDKKTCPGNIDVDKVVELAKQEDEDKNMEITDQTIIPQIESPEGNPMEVQAIRSELYDRRKNTQAKDDEIMELKESLQTTNQQLSDKSLEVNGLRDKVDGKEREKQELWELLDKAKKERDKNAWKADNYDILLKENSELQENNENLRTRVDELSQNAIENISFWEFLKIKLGR